MHLWLSAEHCEAFLLDELRRAFPLAQWQRFAPGLMGTEAALPLAPPLMLVFARQWLPEATLHAAASVSAWSELLFRAVAAVVPEGQPWMLHVEPCYGAGNAGRNRCRFIRESFCELLRGKRRLWLRSLQDTPAPFTPAHSLVQLLLTAPDRGFLSLATAPKPFQWRALLSPFPKGEVPIAQDKAPPSRAFAKLLEAERRLGRRISAGETCVDLGAAPGSWTYVALQRGARVTAVDRSPLRADLMRHPRLHFHTGNAFTFVPEAPVDWLLCDVIAAPDRSIALLTRWLQQRWTRRFVVTIKFKGHADYPRLDELKQTLPSWCEECFLMRLCANRNEACAFGIARPGE